METIIITQRTILKEKVLIFYDNKDFINITKDIIFYLIKQNYKFEDKDFNFSFSYLYGNKEKIIKILNKKYKIKEI